MLSREYLYYQEDSRLAYVVAFYILRHIYYGRKSKCEIVRLDDILSIIGLLASCITIRKSPNLRVVPLSTVRRQSYLAAPDEADRAAASGVQRHQRVERCLVGGGGESEGRLQV